MLPERLRGKRATISSDIAGRVIDGEPFLVTPSDWKMHHFNEVGSRMWLLLSEKKPLDEVVDQIEQEYEVEREVLEKDFVHFIEELLERDLIQLESS
jgi:hypothetical protein